MTDQIQYRAPKWAIELWNIYRFFDEKGRWENRYGVFHAGRLALEAEFGCSIEESMGFFSSEIEPIESDSFGIVELEFEIGDCVKNVKTGYIREFGPEGPVEYGVIEGEDVRGFLVRWDGCTKAYSCRSSDIIRCTKRP